MKEARERRVRRFIREGLACCPPFNHRTVRDLAQKMGHNQGVSGDRVSRLFEEELASQA